MRLTLVSRVAGVAVMAVTAAACGSSRVATTDEMTPAGSPTTTAGRAPQSTTPVGALTVDDVKQAVAASLEANTARFRIDLDIRMPEGVFTQRRRGTYDAAAGVAHWELSWHANADVAKALKIDDLAAMGRQVVTTEDALYEQVRADNPVAPGKWARKTVKELGPEYEGTLEVVPFLLLVLDDVRSPLARPSTADTAFVRVPATVGIYAVPGPSVRNLAAAGADFDKLTGDVVFEVRLDADRRIASVHLKADDILERAYRLAGKPFPQVNMSMEATLTLEDYGVRSDTSVPSGTELLTPAEIARMQADPAR